MRPYDSRGVTLDPGLTALALRAMHDREAVYPFVERYQWRRRSRRPRPVQAAARLASPKPPASFWPRSLRPADLFPTLVRLRRLGGSQSAAA